MISSSRAVHQKRPRSKYDPSPDFVFRQYKKMAPSSPTQEMYSALVSAYSFFNRELFQGKLPSGMLLLHNKPGSLGYYSAERYDLKEGGKPTDAIALNPKHFKGRTTEESLSTLVHEMCHQYEFQVVSHKKKSYHDRSWASVMKSIGLYPSDTAQPGGKETGWRVSHYVVKDGPFQIACRKLIAKGCKIAYTEVGGDGQRTQKKKDRIKFTCGTCGLNAWAKPDALLDCRDCQKPMEAEQ
jgi:predicted SprT family Zn-dependent metalloprotease